MKIEADLSKGGPRLTVKVVEQMAESNWHYEIRLTTTDGLDQKLKMRNGQALTEQDIRLADLTADGFLDLMIVGGKDHRGKEWFKTWLYDPKAKKFKWINDK